MKIETSHAGIVRIAVVVIAVAMSLYHMWAIGFGAPEAFIFRGTHLLFALVLLFLVHRWTGEAKGAPSLLDYALLLLGVAPIVHIFFNYEYIVTRIFYIDDLTALDMIMGTIMTLIVLEATRRVIGWTLPLTAIIFLAYGLLIARLEPMRLLDQLYMTTEGIFGIPLAVSASYVLIFVLFGSFMERTGTGQLFMDFAMALTGSAAGGPGKVSVFSSSLFGTISGSAVANVMVDGPITIPLMKRTGFRPPFAAAVESVASTGGQIMPPIMGAAAFVMAEFLAVSYLQVTMWAAIPALLYYVAVFFAVHFESKRVGLLGLPRSEIPRFIDVMRERGHLFLPILVVLGGLIAGYSAPLCALAGTLSCVPVALLRKSTRKNIGWMTIWHALEDGAKNSIAVALACACAGIIIGVITMTGAAINFTSVVLGLAKDLLPLALVLTMLAGIVLGMGMPTTPAYIVMVSLLVPALIKLGAIPPAAHMFAFYFAILSAITPPVALAVYAAAGIAKADLWESGWAAVRVGAAGFIVPFMFVFEPSLLMIGDWFPILTSTISATIGVICLAGGLHGYLFRPVWLWERIALVTAAVLLIKPGYITDAIGLALLLSVIVNQKLISPAKSSAAPSVK